MQETPAPPNRIWRKKWFRRLLMGGAALIVLLPLSGAIYQWAATRNFERQNPPRGELIDVGGYRLHLHRQGQGKGSPVVVIDAGLAGGSYEWDALAAEMSTVTEVCTYDRAGSAGATADQVLAAASRLWRSCTPCWKRRG